jgi:hypothetical protein
MHLDTQVKGPVSGARVRRNAAFGRAILMAFGTGLVWLLLAGCHRSPISIPESPPEAATMVMQRLVDNQPRVLWDALPPSYRSDIRGLIVTFCDHMDPEVYDRTFRVLNKGIGVLRQKQEFLFNSPYTLDNVLLDSGIGLHWKQSVGILETLINSDIARLDSLRQLDPGVFLASTGNRVMSDLERLTRRIQRSPESNPWERAREALARGSVRFVPGEGEEGFLTFGSRNDEEEREVRMVQVEGRWVPAEMAATWKTNVAEMQAGLERLGSPEAQRAKPMILMILGALERSMDTLLQSRSQQEFDAAFRSLQSIGEMASALREAGEPTSRKGQP